MLVREPIHATEAQFPQRDTAAAAVREALAVLERASSDWRNGNASIPGPLHWTVAIPAAREALIRALETLEPQESPDAIPAGDCPELAGFEGVLDVPAAIARYNSWSRAERGYWHRIAGSAVPADAYKAYCEGVYAP